MPLTSAKPRILFLNRSYYPDAEATGQLLTQLCEDLAADFTVDVIAGQPNANPSEADFLKYGKENRLGVTIRRVWHTRFSKASSIGRIVNWVTFSCLAAIAAISGPRPDIVVVETDPPLLCLVGGLVRRWHGAKLVIYLQDIYPDLGVAIGKLPNNWLVRSLRAAFFRVYRGANRIIVLSDDMRDLLAESGISPRNIAKIPNWIDCSRIKPVKQSNSFRDELKLNDRFIVMHSGNLGLCQGLETVVDAAGLLQHRPDICFVLVGDGAAKRTLVDVVHERGLQNVHFTDYQPATRLSESLSAADLHLVAVDPRVIRFLMPSKFYGVLASGTPVLAIAPRGSELARIVEQEEIGTVAPPNSPAVLADRIVEMADLPYDFPEMGLRARRLAERRFDRTISVTAFSNLLMSVAGAEAAGEADGRGSGRTAVDLPGGDVAANTEPESEEIAKSPSE